MILRSIQVRHWGALESFGVALEPGANLLHGPNGSGKSSLVGAICRGLFDRHDSRAAELLTVRPWGTCLAPAVTLEFETQGEIYRLHKQFLDEPSCQLERQQPSGWRLLAEGKQADRAILELLEAPGSKSGASRPRDRGISQLLWALQGDVGMPPTLTGETGYALRQSAGQLLESPASRRVAERIEAAYQATFRANGSLRKSAGPSQLRSELIQLTARRESLSGLLDDWAGRRERLAFVEQAVAEARTVLVRLCSEHEQAAQVLSQAETHRQRRREADLAYEAAAANWRELSERARAIGQRRATVAETGAQLVRLQASLVSGESEQVRQQALVETSRERAIRLRRRWGLIRDQLRETEVRGERRSMEERMRSLSGRIERTSELSAWLQARRHERELLHVPPAEVRQRLSELTALAAIRLTFTADSRMTLSCDVDGEVREVMLEPDQQHELRPSGRAELILPGVGRVEVSTAERDQLATLALQYGGRTPEELMEAVERHQVLSREIDQLEAELRGLTPGGPLALNEELVRLQGEMVRLPESKASALPLDPGVTAEDVSCAEREFDEADKAHGDSAEALAGVAADVSALRAQVCAAERASSQLGTELERLTGDGLSDVERQEAVTAAQGQLAAAERLRQELEEAREQVEGIPNRRVAELDRSIAAKQSEIAAREAEVNRLRGALATISEDEAAEQLPALEARMHEIERRLERETLRADGLRLLYRRYLEEREASIESVLDPIAENVIADLADLGQPLRRLAFDRDLGLDGLEVERGVPVGPVALSHGTWIQLVTLIRLNLGELLSTREPQLVILDDTLVHSDAERMARMLPRVARAAERLQILLVTCHPASYDSLAANRVDLAELRALEV